MAGIRWTQVEIPLGGVDQYTDAPHVIPGSLLELENARFRNPPSLGKRWGFTKLGQTDLDANNLTEGVRLIAHGKKILQASSEKLYEYSEKANKWADRGFLSECLLDRIPIASEMNQDMADGTCLTSNGLRIVAWTSDTGDRAAVAILDAANNAVLNVQNFTGTYNYCRRPKLIAIGTTVLLFQETTGTAIVYRTLDTTATPYAFSSGTLLGTTFNPNFDNCTFDVTTDGTSYWVGYKRDGVDAVIIEQFNSSHVSQAWASRTAAAVYAIAVHSNSATSYAWLCHVEGTNGMEVATFPKALNTLTGSSVVSSDCTSSSRIGICKLDATRALVAYDEPYNAASDLRNQHIQFGISLATSPGFTPSKAYDLVLCGQPFRYSNGNTYVLASFGSPRDRSTAGTSLQETFFLVELLHNDAVNSTPRWVGTACRGIAKAPTKNGYLPQADTGSDDVRWAQPVKKRFEYAKDDDGTIILSRCSIQMLDFDFAVDNLHANAQWGRGLFFAGARPGWYDGKRVTEHGFAWTPEGYSTAQGVGGGLTTGSLVPLVMTYEHEDNNGAIIRSAPGGITTISMTSSNTLLGLTQLQDVSITARPQTTVQETRLFTYRCVAGATLPYYRAISQVNGVNSAFNTADSIGGTGETDTDIVLKDVLYTTGDILDNAGTPPCKYVTYHGERLWLAGMEDPTWIWFSQPYVEGEQPRFNEALRLNIGGDVTAIASMDSALIAFTETSIYAIHGDGPPATGGLDIGFAVNRISSDVGCIDWRSVVLIPAGLMFQSKKGIYLLGRDMSVTWVGAPIKTYLTTYPTVVGSTMLKASQEVIFAAKGTDTQARLVYNYQLDKWSIDPELNDEIPASVACTWDAGDSVWNLMRLTTGAICKRETPDAYDEGTAASAHYGIKVTTPWIGLNTVQGWQRIRKLLLLLDPDVTNASGINVEVGFDYATTYAETHSWTAAEVAALSRKQIEVHLAKQQCEAVRFRITETADVDDTPSAGPKLRSLVLEAGIRPARTMQLADGTERK